MKMKVLTSGPGMDSSKENSISMWWEIRASRRLAVCREAPYVPNPFFGMFSCGGLIASMHLRRYEIVSSKTKESEKDNILQLSREALVTKSSGKCIWKAGRGLRNPSDEEVKLSPHGSFTKVEIQNLKMECLETRKLQCFLKDIYFPYIQLTVTEETSLSSASTSHHQPNARLKFVYFPIVEDKVNIDKIIEQLESDGFSKKEFGCVSIQGPGRLLPHAR